jgi:hypothetical protein
MTTSLMETACWLRFVATARHGVLTDVVTELRQASGFVALTGSSGVGKTTLARAARDLLRQHGFEVMWIDRGDRGTIGLRTIAAQLLDKPEATINGDDVEPLFDVMTTATLERRLVIVVDDAEVLHAEVFGYLRLLPGIAVEAMPQFLFVGAPSFWDRSPELTQADVRDVITCRHELEPLSTMECRQFAELFLVPCSPAAMRTLDDPEFEAKIADTGGLFARLVPLLSAVAETAEDPAPADGAPVPLVEEPVEERQAVHPRAPSHRVPVFASFAGLIVVTGLIGVATYEQVSTNAERTVIEATGRHSAIVPPAPRPAAAAEPPAAAPTIATADLQQVQPLFAQVGPAEAAMAPVTAVSTPEAVASDMALSPAAKLSLASSLSPDPPNDVGPQATIQDMQGSVAAAPSAAAPEPKTVAAEVRAAPASEPATEVQTAAPLRATSPTAEARAAPAVAETSTEAAPTSAQVKEVQVAEPSQASPPVSEPAKEIKVAEPPQATPPASAEAPAAPAVAETATEAAAASEPAKKTQIPEPPQATSPASAEAPASPAVSETSTEAAPASEPSKETQVAEPPPAAPPANGPAAAAVEPPKPTEQPVTAAPAQHTPSAAVAPAHQAAPPVASGVDTPPASADEPSTPSEPVTVPTAPTGAVAADPAAPAAPPAPEPPKSAAAVPRYAAPDPAALVARGDAMLELGDVSAARLLYERAAALGNAKAATAAGKTYDPAFLTSIRASGLVPDRATAAAWYQKGVALGDREAADRLAKLSASQ